MVPRRKQSDARRLVKIRKVPPPSCAAGAAFLVHAMVFVANRAAAGVTFSEHAAGQVLKFIHCRPFAPGQAELGPLAPTAVRGRSCLARRRRPRPPRDASRNPGASENASEESHPWAAGVASRRSGDRNQAPRLQSAHRLSPNLWPVGRKCAGEPLLPKPLNNRDIPITVTCHKAQIYHCFIDLLGRLLVNVEFNLEGS